MIRDKIKFDLVFIKVEPNLKCINNKIESKFGSIGVQLQFLSRASVLI